MKKNTLLYIFLFLPEIICIIWTVCTLSSCYTPKPRYESITIMCDSGHVHTIRIIKPIPSLSH